MSASGGLKGGPGHGGGARRRHLDIFSTGLSWTLWHAEVLGFLTSLLCEIVSTFLLSKVFPEHFKEKFAWPPSPVPKSTTDRQLLSLGTVRF